MVGSVRGPGSVPAAVGGPKQRSRLRLQRRRCGHGGSASGGSQTRSRKGCDRPCAAVRVVIRWPASGFFRTPSRESTVDRRRRRVSMSEVAALADVAISSVSRVLSDHPDVSDEMRARVLAAVAQLEYEPDFLAQSLRRGETRSVGFVVGDISNPLFANVAWGVETVLQANGYSLMFMNSESEPALDVAHIRFFLSRRVDGLILSLASEQDPATLEQLAKLEVPIVVVDRDLPPELGASAVQSDHATGMREAVDHLLDLGHRRIALVAGSLAIRPGPRSTRGDAGGDRRAGRARRDHPHAGLVHRRARRVGHQPVAGPPRAADRHHRRRQPPVRGMPDRHHPARVCASARTSRWSPATTSRSRGSTSLRSPRSRGTGSSSARPRRACCSSVWSMARSPRPRSSRRRMSRGRRWHPPRATSAIRSGVPAAVASARLS